MRLFIAEKPSLGRAIANGLGNQKKSDGCIICGNDTVTWCFGHMLMLAWPQDYDPAFANWKREHLPIIPTQWRNTIKKEASSQLKLIGKLLKKSECVVNAGDPDREGQLLVDEVLEHFGYKGKVLRIWLASLDDKSVKKAIAAISDNSGFHSLRDSAIARSRADWLVGINATRAMTIKGRDTGKAEILSLGRVQTPTLALVVNRDREIKNFVPVDFFTLVTSFAHEDSVFSAEFIPSENQNGLDAAGRLVDQAEAETLANRLKGKYGTILENWREEKSKVAPLPHCLSSLQKAASSKYGFSAQTVLDTAQKLYEKKLTTYPRTDCRYLPEEQFENAQEILKALAGVDGLEEISALANHSLKSAAWNTQKITAHHAIIPTGEKPANLGADERILYQMIALGYCLQFYPALRYEAQKIRVKLDDTIWEAKGRKIIEAGWTAIHSDEEDEAANSLPDLAQDEKLECSDIAIQKKKTTPPSHFTEGTLIEAMANVHRFVDDTQAKAALKEAKGIGTEATRAKVLETLKERKYLATSKKVIISTPLGQELIDLAPQPLKDPLITAEWESRLEKITSGEETLAAFMSAQNEALPELIKAILGDDKPAFPCPECGAALVRRKSRKGNSWFWACTAYPDCKAIFSDEDGKPAKPREKPVPTEFKCPDCGKPLVKRKSSKGEFFGCSGFPQCKRTFSLNNEGKPDFDAKPYEKRKR